MVVSGSRPRFPTETSCQEGFLYMTFFLRSLRPQPRPVFGFDFDNLANSRLPIRIHIQTSNRNDEKTSQQQRKLTQASLPLTPLIPLHPFSYLATNRARFPLLRSSPPRTPTCCSARGDLRSLTLVLLALRALPPDLRRTLCPRIASASAIRLPGTGT
jgi:hypothetical protein